MNKLKITALFAACLIFAGCLVLAAAAYADTSCPPKCPQTQLSEPCSKFLCTNSEIEDIFYKIGLSDSQVCTASKLQEKYAQETLSINERIAYEENILNSMKSSCSKGREVKEQKNKIKKLEKSRKKICRCYENQFKVMLSPQQWKKYKKYKNS